MELAAVKQKFADITMPGPAVSVLQIRCLECKNKIEHVFVTPARSIGICTTVSEAPLDVLFAVKKSTIFCPKCKTKHGVAINHIALLQKII